MAVTAPEGYGRVNSGIVNNEYTNLEQRRKQYLSQLPVSQDPVVTSKGGTDGAGAAATVADPAENAADGYLSILKQMQKDKDRQVQAAYDDGKANLDAAREAANRDAYVAYMHGLKNMPQISAVSGNGGYAQSLATKQQLNYENNRAATHQNYMNNLRQLQANRDNGIISNSNEYLTQLAAARKDEAADAAKAAARAVTATAAAVPAANTYKLNGKTYTDQEFVTYLKNMGMSQAEIARYMQSHGLTL